MGCCESTSNKVETVETANDCIDYSRVALDEKRSGGEYAFGELWMKTTTLLYDGIPFWSRNSEENHNWCQKTKTGEWYDVTLSADGKILTVVKRNVSSGSETKEVINVKDIVSCLIF
jgi:hypothetical protein